jgi:GGDEF domain-containing protein
MTQLTRRLREQARSHMNFAVYQSYLRIRIRINSDKPILSSRAVRLFASSSMPSCSVRSLDSLFARADAAMYEAKRQGKNRIISA